MKTRRRSSATSDVRTTTYVGGIRFYNNDTVKRVKLLGRGHYGDVYLATIQPESDEEEICESKVVAMKAQKRTDGFSPEMMRELQAMTAVPPHRNVLELVGMLPFGDKGKTICFLTSYCEMGSLDKLHKKVDMVSPSGFKKVALDVARGLAHLHRIHLLHRDLACRNLLMKADGTVAIADFGLATKLDGPNGSYHSTEPVAWQWTAPESIETSSYTLKSDIWSLGVTFWEILTRGERPYSELVNCGVPSHRITKSVLEGKVKLRIPENRPYAVSMVGSCLNLDSVSRPIALEVLEMVDDIAATAKDAKVTNLVSVLLVSLR